MVAGLLYLMVLVAEPTLRPAGSSAASPDGGETCHYIGQMYRPPPTLEEGWPRISAQFSCCPAVCGSSAQLQNTKVAFPKCLLDELSSENATSTEDTRIRCGTTELVLMRA